MHYFDNAATTFPKPETVYSSMDNFYRNYGVNVGRGQFKEASIASKMVDETRELLLELFHVDRGTRQVIFTPSATEALNLIINGLGLSKDDVVYITPFEHNAVLRVLNKIAKDNGVLVKTISPDYESLTYNLETIRDDFEKSNPKVVIVNHASNAFGNVSPINTIFLEAKKYGAITVADMSQTAGLVDVNLLECQCDYAVFEGHKTLYGPFGAAGVIMPNNAGIEPLIYGGTGVDSANLNMPVIEPIRYEAGSPNILSISGLNASLKWIKEIGINEIRKKEDENAIRLFQLLNSFSNITVHRGNKCENIGIISCTFDGYSSDNIGQVLSEKDIAVRTGLHCAPEAHKFMNTAPAGTVRFSVNYFTSDDDFEALKAALEYIELNS